jgi:hypothetical protein
MQTSLEINANGEVRCPDCSEMIRVGNAAIENLNKQLQMTLRPESLCGEQEKK